MFKRSLSHCQKRSEKESCLLTANAQEIWEGRMPLLNGNETVPVEQILPIHSTIYKQQ